MKLHANVLRKKNQIPFHLEAVGGQGIHNMMDHLLKDQVVADEELVLIEPKSKSVPLGHLSDEEKSQFLRDTEEEQAKNVGYCQYTKPLWGLLREV